MKLKNILNEIKVNQPNAIEKINVVEVEGTDRIWSATVLFTNGEKLKFSGRNALKQIEEKFGDISNIKKDYYPIDLSEDMMKGQFDKAKPKTPGRRYIPQVVSFDKNKIDQLNKEKNGPHIQLLDSPPSSYETLGIGKPKEGIKLVRLLVSPLLFTAISQTQRGRTSRDIEVYKAPLLKRYQEIFSNEQSFKGYLKQALEQATLQKTSKGDFYLARETMPIFYAEEQNLVVLVLKAKQAPDDLKTDTIREIE